MNDLTVYEDKSILVMDNIPPFCEEEYDLFDKKDFAKYVADGEKLIRGSFEYRQLVNYLRDYMDMNKCSIFQNVSNEESFKIKIHIHHCPFTLYEYFITVFNKRMYMREPLDIELVAHEVMYLHYFLMVGLIPLAETVHDLVHKQVLFIPLDNVMGNYQLFEQNYSQFIPEESKTKLETMRKQTELYNQSYNMSILERKPVYIELKPEEGSYIIPNAENMEALIDSMFDRIKEIKGAPEQKAIGANTYDNNVIMTNPIYHDYSKDGNMIMPIYHDYSDLYTSV